MLELDENGYDPNGFNIDGIHRDTKTRFDKDGLDKQGYDEFGLNIYGYTRDGHSITKDKDGNLTLVLTATTTRMLSPQGDKRYNKDSINTRGFFRGGKNVLCIKKDATPGDRLAIHDRRGFLEDGTHIETRTKYNKYGYDAYGYNKDGFDEYGFNRDGINEYTGTILDSNGHDCCQARAYMRGKAKMPEELDEYGFDEKGMWNRTSKFSKETGFDIEGYNIEGFNLNGINRDGFRKDGIHSKTGTKFNLDGYDINGYNEAGYDKDGYDKLGIDKNGLNKETNQKDKRITFAEEFINSGKSIEMFSKEHAIPASVVKKDLDILKDSPFISAKIIQALQRNADKYINTIFALKDRLIEGKISIKEVKDVRNVLRICSDDEKQKVLGALMKGASTHTISILEYKSIFGIENFEKNLPQDIMNNFDEIILLAKKSGNKELTSLVSGLYKEKDRIKTYRAPYKPEDLKFVGYIKEGENNPTRLEITEEHIDMAEEYLKATGEFICYKTMADAFMKMAKGELNRDVLTALINNKKDATENKEQEKQELVESILRQQEHIAEQNQEIKELESQRGLTDGR